MEMMDQLSQRPGVERSLRELRTAIIGPRPQAGDAGPFGTTTVTDVDTGATESYSMRRSEKRLAEAAREALAADLRFEYLRKPGQQIDEFISRCHFHPGETIEDWFILTYARRPTNERCYLPVENLRAAVPLEILGLTLLPFDDPSLPDDPWLLEWKETAGSVAVVEVAGTGKVQMKERAQESAAHALRVLRIALREHNAIHNHQLRFRLGTSYAFDDGTEGSRTRGDVAYQLEIDSDLLLFAKDQVVVDSPLVTTTEIERQVDITLRWMERAMFADDPLIGVLYSFFAFEALIGYKISGHNGVVLAFRQMMLGHIVDGHFSDPFEPLLMYKSVRNTAVHGESLASIDEDTLSGFLWTVRRTLNQCLKLTKERSFTESKELRDGIEQHCDRAQLTRWLMDATGRDGSGDEAVDALIRYAATGRTTKPRK
jgi:hypothetical protein